MATEFASDGVGKHAVLGQNLLLDLHQPLLAHARHVGLGSVLAEMQVAVARIFDWAVIMVVMMIAIMTMMMGMTVVVPIMMMVMLVLMASIELDIALAIDANVLRPAAAYLAHGYLPFLFVDELLAEGSPA
ncbi:hypothetical protein [Aminobacter carboxidus]|uniref:hypothetical protein n=1 Tax=Aminobacter carboxidus TaxID=376165 RepID=UPI001FE97323|nr:hypothetical protein [Aminobacter carboxidus]